ncbi:MAG TPA: UDP-N-acetylmuramate:L-alanyl-gamma-D-glutamyl-meso-diaminopimelate ligase [Rhodocyclaceae bacterium]|nr:UDP-N-acetylmuramate:L-alanyl-gamma-D-glutamyl-meso-diaminopimelate ligase [Rhodocyclaceae bacterium]
MHVHILGICGTFMGGVALLARAAGHRVSGCDANVYPPMSVQLEQSGIALTEGYDASQAECGADIFLVGNAISRGNPLLEVILERGLAYSSGPQWLAEHVLPGRWVLAVAGTHGKTTTSSMLAWILECAGLDPSFLIGGVPANFGLSARLTLSRFFVIEADEYDTAFSDKRSKFVHYRPRTLVCNNLEFDHADIFPDLAAIERQFHHVVRTMPASGLILCDAASPALDRVLAQGVWSRVAKLDADDGWWLRDQTGRSFEFGLGPTRWASASLDMPGRHNRRNALAAIAAAVDAGVAPDVAAGALASFKGVARRLEPLGTVRGITVYDDFAHHPTAIAASIAALRERVGAARILALIEPRSNTMRRGTLNAALPGALAGADLVFCYAHGLDWDVRALLAPHGANVVEDLDDMVSAVVASAYAGDHVLVMSNGGFGGIHRKLMARLDGGKCDGDKDVVVARSTRTL